jgi:trehalose 6-phosphate synthase
MIGDRAEAGATAWVRGTRVRTGPAELVVVTDEMPPPPGVAGPSGLTDDPVLTALASLVDRPERVWVGRDRRTGGAVGSVSARPEETADYLNHAEQTIWPVYHDLCRPADFHAQWRAGYRRVSTAVAEAVADSAAHGASVWIHDYQLQLVPARLRMLRPDLRIGFSLHTAFPPPELFEHMPMRREILDGLLGADTIGFQTAASAENFLRLATGAQEGRALAGRMPMVGVFPATVDGPMVGRLAALEKTAVEATSIRSDLGSPKVVVLSLDNGDEASGVDRRLRAIGSLLDGGQVDPGDVAFVQVVSQRRAAGGDTMHDRISREVAHINGRHATVGRPCVHYAVESPDLARRVALYRAADVMMSTPLRDGANLPALEFVAACGSNAALVLSEFSGSANVLTQAYQVNPYDEDQLKSRLLAALTSSEAERAERMNTMRRYLLGYDTQAWMRSFLAALRPMPHVVSAPAPTARTRPATPQPRPATHALTAGSEAEPNPRTLRRRLGVGLGRPATAPASAVARLGRKKTDVIVADAGPPSQSSKYGAWKSSRTPVLCRDRMPLV